MKKILLFVGLLSLATSANADFVASGTITKFHVGPDDFAIYLKSTKGCPSQWYYSYRKETEPDTWKMLFDLALLAYEKRKSLSIFYSSADCNLKRFKAIDTIN
jgi:hypothetical protein